MMIVLIVRDEVFQLLYSIILYGRSDFSLCRIFYQKLAQNHITLGASIVETTHFFSLFLYLEETIIPALQARLSKFEHVFTPI